MSMLSRSHYDLYRAWCKERRLTEDRKEFAAWKQTIARIFKLLAEAGIDRPEAWVLCRSADYRSRGIEHWGLAMLLVDARRALEAKVVSEHEAQKKEDNAGVKRRPKWTRGGEHPKARWRPGLHSSSDLARQFMERHDEF